MAVQVKFFSQSSHTHTNALFKWAVIGTSFCEHFLGAINEENESIFLAPLKLKKKQNNETYKIMGMSFCSTGPGNI